MINNIGLIKLRRFSDKYGNLIPIEGNLDIPFEIKRIYFIYGVDKNITRGFHAHRKLHQILICVNGKVKIKIKTPSEEEIVELNDPSVGLYLGRMTWREMFDFSEDAVLLVLASQYYDEKDYIRNYDFYLKEFENMF